MSIVNTRVHPIGSEYRVECKRAGPQGETTYLDISCGMNEITLHMNSPGQFRDFKAAVVKAVDEFLGDMGETE